MWMNTLHCKHWISISPQKKPWFHADWNRPLFHCIQYSTIIKLFWKMRYTICLCRCKTKFKVDFKNRFSRTNQGKVRTYQWSLVVQNGIGPYSDSLDVTNMVHNLFSVGCVCFEEIFERISKGVLSLVWLSDQTLAKWQTHMHTCKQTDTAGGSGWCTLLCDRKPKGEEGENRER